MFRMKSDVNISVYEIFLTTFRRLGKKCVNRGLSYMVSPTSSESYCLID